MAAAFMEVGEFIESDIGDVLIQQGSWDDDFYFIICGAFEVIINKQRRTIRRGGTHVGELTSLKPDRARTATIRALENSLTLKISNADMDSIVGGNAGFWRRMADLVAGRLDERNAFIAEANEYPRVFVISSSERIDVARCVRSNLDGDNLHVQLWDSGTFNISEYPISALEDAIEAADFTISVIAPDDGLVMRGETSKVARDNVHLEFGISLGKLAALDQYY